MICHNNVVVSASGTIREATHVMGVYLAAGFYPDVEFLGLDGGELAGDVRKGVDRDKLILFFRGLDTFARLGGLSFEGLF